MWLSKVRTVSRPVAFVCLLALLSAAEADAQVGTQPGQAILPLSIITPPGAVDVRFAAPIQFRDAMTAAGGVTVFAASAPNGPLFVRLPFPGPFPPPPTEEMDAYGWYFPGVPPGTYYLAVIIGLVTTTNIPDAAWTRVVVAGPTPCTAPPGQGLVSRDLAGVTPDAVRLFLSSYGGCAPTHVVEVGTAPGTANVVRLEQPGAVLSATAVPSGSYYVRVAGRNAYGLGPQSAVLPVAVPPCTSQNPDELDGLTVNVTGNLVTLTWTAPVTPPGRPVTYYEIGLLHARPSLDAPEPRILLPGGITSYSATVPSGHYLINLHAGNACGTWTTDAAIIDVP